MIQLRLLVFAEKYNSFSPKLWEISSIDKLYNAYFADIEVYPVLWTNVSSRKNRNQSATAHKKTNQIGALPIILSEIFIVFRIMIGQAQKSDEG